MKEVIQLHIVVIVHIHTIQLKLLMNVRHGKNVKIQGVVALDIIDVMLLHVRCIMKKQKLLVLVKKEINVGIKKKATFVVFFIDYMIIICFNVIVSI